MQQNEFNDGRNINMKPWTIRRRIIYLTLIFCACSITYIMIWGGDTRVNEAIILGSFSAATMVIGSYVFGSVWSDNTSKNIHMTNQRGGITIAPNATIVSPITETESPAQRKERAKARLARMRAKRAAADNPDG